jgi:hypothetical protein
MDFVAGFQTGPVNLVTDFAGEFADVDDVVNLVSTYEFSCIAWLTTSLRVEDGLI